MRNFLQTLRDAIKGTEENLTEIPLNRAIILLAVPMILEMVMESLFAVVDAFFVAQVGPQALTTVGLTESVMFLVYSLGIGLSMAATAMVARRAGEGDVEGASIAAGQAIWLGVMLSILVAVLGVGFADDILRLMGGSEELIINGVNYTRIMFGTNIVIMLIFLLNGIFRGVGNAAIAMRTLWLSNGINIVLDPCLIQGIGPFPELGLEGAAIATSIGRGIGVLFQLYHLFNGKAVLKMMRRHFVWVSEIITKLVSVGAGGAGQYLISSASWIFLMRIMAEFSEEVVAGYVVAIRIIIFAILPAWGLANAAATLVGQNLGAKAPDRASKAAWTTAFYAMLYLLILSGASIWGAPYIVAFFGQTGEGLQAGVEALQTICIGYVFYAYGMVMIQALNGAGDTRTPTLVNFICFWLVQVPIAYGLAVYADWGPQGVYWAIVIASAFYAAVSIWFFQRGKWKEVAI